ncbi:hypothetical protein BS78_10G161000 [Paspalum vaginatum]|nr:hypothetical protein BS78_10G161000 [Paspalum vaginatum]
MLWKDDPFGVPLWSERPRCRCGFCAWMVTTMDRSDRNYGRRCFKCPDLDNDFMMDEAREAERQAILEREHKQLNRRRDDLVAREIELKRREDDLKRCQDLLRAAEQRDTNDHGTSSSRGDKKGKNLQFTQ